MSQTPNSDKFFAGNAVHSLDEKNRVTIPSRWRVDLPELYAVRPSSDDVIHLMPVEEMQRLLEKLLNGPLEGKDRIAAQRSFFGSAHQCPIDKAGRLTVPVDWSQDLKMEKEVVLCGAGNRIEVRSTEAWQSLQEDEMSGRDLVTEALAL